VRRRDFLAAAGSGLLVPWKLHAAIRYPAVVAGRELRLPGDHGAHPDYRVEWWYVTGWLDGQRRGPRGFQVTFFRARPEHDPDNPSAFTPRQVLLAHAALADPSIGRLVHDERAARAGFGLAEAQVGRTSVWIDEWRLEQEGSRYHARIVGRELDMDLELIAREVVLQGDRGYSRKGHRPEEASYYYSRPHIAVAGRVGGQPAEGVAWLDHEWSSAYLAPEAAGWDWCGINLFDGSSLMAFRMRAKSGGTHYAAPGVAFEVLRTWKSPRTGVEYPVSMAVSRGGRRLRLEPLMDDQELDARASTGTIYWEGAVRAFEGEREAGRGYLELTGYWRPMKL
jgi:predicted secreted hydrolase